MTSSQAAVAWCPFPDRETAKALAAKMLEERLIACANMIAIDSVFLWKGEVSTGDEIAVLFKTTSDRLERLVERLGQEHPYDTPAIIGWACDTAHPQTLEWLADATGAA